MSYAELIALANRIIDKYLEEKMNLIDTMEQADERESRKPVVLWKHSDSRQTVQLIFHPLPFHYSMLVEREDGSITEREFGRNYTVAKATCEEWARNDMYA